jgi:hypothetical protein
MRKTWVRVVEIIGTMQRITCQFCTQLTSHSCGLGIKLVRYPRLTHSVTIRLATTIRVRMSLLLRDLSALSTGPISKLQYRIYE